MARALSAKRSTLKRGSIKLNKNKLSSTRKVKRNSSKKSQLNKNKLSSTCKVKRNSSKKSQLNKNKLSSTCKVKRNSSKKSQLSKNKLSSTRKVKRNSIKKSPKRGSSKRNSSKRNSSKRSSSRRGSSKRSSSKRSSSRRGSSKRSSSRRGSSKRSSSRRGSSKRSSSRRSSPKKTLRRKSQYKMRGMGGLLTMYGGAGEELEALYNKKKQEFIKAKNNFMTASDPLVKQELRKVLENSKGSMDSAKLKMYTLLNGVSDAATRAAQHLGAQNGGFDINAVGSSLNKAINSDISQQLLKSNALKQALSIADPTGNASKYFNKAVSTGVINSLGTKEGFSKIVTTGLSELS